jgi:hypothetical protein
MKARLEGNMGKNDEMAGFADADEEFGAGDPPINWARLEEVAAVFAEMEPLDALRAIYGEKLDVPS